MKNIRLYIIMVGLITLMVSCDDMLNLTNPNQQDTSNFWETEQDLIDGLNAAYRPLRFNGEYRRWLHILYVSRSDEGYSTSPNPTFQSYSNFKTLNNDAAEAVLYTWLDLYKGIFWANQVLDNAPNAPIEDEVYRDRIMGQAYFLRGLGYFNIAGVYGRGPITLTSYVEDNPKIYEQHEIYLQAQKDFDEARKRLPAYWEETTDLGRITKGGALGMLVKVSAQLHEWQSVKNYCDTIFDMKGAGGVPLYSLVADYRENFTDVNENNSESLFEVQFMSGPVNGVGQLSQERAKFLGLPANGCSYDDGTAGNIVKTDLEMEKTVDGNVDPRLKNTLFYYDPNNTTELFYGKTWLQWENDGGSSVVRSKVYWKKYTNYDTRTTEDHENNGINFRVVRLADIYLMYAEALNELGLTSEAYEYINKVRSRVNLPDLQNSTVFTGIGNDQDKMRDQIMHERSCELAGESWRWLDLERWGMFESEDKIAFLKQRDSEFNNFVIGKSNRFPIPYREVNLVPSLEQNPGYE
ncbi:RagB/SusD family nutrient uptake outer membrane protein [Saccharicrinis sp. FJH62]|uniref:RagB/SusD family nutrient uptake outer membrane protein n=1 Tax=Saccharicrinis sp. FJH62 TaxID=3344657 RepID=UPI0035D3EC8E